MAKGDEVLTMMKVDRELEDAISKHGKVEIPESFEEQFKGKVESAKQKIVQM